MKSCGSFDMLEPGRQEALVRASVRVFGTHGYKDASTGEIARGAGMSKGLLFFYCRTKRDLYGRVLDYMTDQLLAVVMDESFLAIDDFFELMAYAARCKADVFRRFPGLLDFSLRAFYPEHRDARHVMSQWIAQQMDVLVEVCFAHVDTGRFLRRAKSVAQRCSCRRTSLGRSGACATAWVLCELAGWPGACRWTSWRACRGAPFG